jgi:hypothetical protein
MVSLLALEACIISGGTQASPQPESFRHNTTAGFPKKTHTQARLLLLLRVKAKQGALAFIQMTQFLSSPIWLLLRDEESS